MPGTPLAEAFVAVRADTSKVKGDVDKGFSGASDDAEKHGKSAGSKFAKGLAAAAGGAAIAGAFNFGREAIDSASGLAETINKSSVIFGKNAQAVESWAAGAAKNVGLTKAAALEAAAGFGNMFSQLGFAGDQSAAMSEQVVKLSADLGSFNNLPTQEVADSLSGAFRGEFDSLQRLIPNINAARVEQEAMTATGKTAASQLTAQEKAAATLAIVQRDGAAANNDFANTSGGAANQSKILAAQFGDLAAQVGTALLPLLTKAGEVLLSVVGYIQQNISWIQPLVIALGVLAAATYAVNLAMSLNPFGIVVIAIAALVAGIVIAYQKSETFRDIVNAVWASVKTAILTAWDYVIHPTIDALVGGFQWAWEHAQTLARIIGEAWTTVSTTTSDIFGRITSTVRGVFEGLAGVIRGPINAVIGLINGLIDKINVILPDNLDLPFIPALTGPARQDAEGAVRHAMGGPIRGPGGGTDDRVPIMGSAGEWVIRAAAAAALGTDMMSLINSADRNGLADISGDPGALGLKFAGGGQIPAIQDFIKSTDPLPYIWGGVGPGGYDCSGLTGAVYGKLLGEGGVGRRYFTTLSNFPGLGFRRGTGTYTVGVSDTHMAGNLAGLAFEAASTKSGIHVGGSAKDVMSFPAQYFLPQVGDQFVGGGGGGGPSLGFLLKAAFDLASGPLMAAVGGIAGPLGPLGKVLEGVAGRTRDGIGSKIATFDNGGTLGRGLNIVNNATGGRER
ncbi:MAG: hypothetical protein ABJA74_15825, partial [Lapillicoccus sp.]